MKENRKQKGKEITLRSLKAKLRCLSQVEAPKTLEGKLLEAIVDRKRQTGAERLPGFHRRTWDFGASAAAAILIFALMLVVNYGLSVPSQMLATELDDVSLCYARYDHNNLLYDQNYGSVENSLPANLIWSTVNCNEPGD